jgi:hypothetical protein
MRHDKGSPPPWALPDKFALQGSRDPSSRFSHYREVAKHRTHSIEFKRQVAQDFIAGETLGACLPTMRSSAAMLRTPEEDRLRGHPHQMPQPQVATIQQATRAAILRYHPHLAFPTGSEEHPQANLTARPQLNSSCRHYWETRQAFASAVVLSELLLPIASRF